MSFQTNINKQYGNNSTVDVVIANMRSELVLNSSLKKNTQDPFEYKYQSPIGIGQKLVIYQEPSIITSGSGVVSGIKNQTLYNVPVIFDLPMNGMYLSQIIIECTLSTSGDNTMVEPRLGSRIFSLMQLVTTRGQMSIDRSIKPSYTNARLDELPDTYKQIELSTDPNTIFNGNTVQCYTPCFFWTSEKVSNFLMLDNTISEPLQLACITNTSYQSMGLDANITDMSFRAILTYFRVFSGVPRTLNWLPNPLVLLTDVWYEPDVSLIAGTTSIIVPITCQMPVLNMHIQIHDNSQEYLTTSSFTFFSGTDVITSIARNMNYSLLTSFGDYQTGTTENNYSGTFTYWFGLLRSRNDNQFPLSLHNISSPNVQVNFPAIPNVVGSTYSIKVFFEYWNERLLRDTYYVRQLQY
jgi:hypothetical protein